MSSRCARCGKPLSPNQSPSSTQPHSSTQHLGDSLCLDCRDLTIDSGSGEGTATKTWYKPRDFEDRVQQYTLVRQLGRGSFGDVWLADDSRLGRAVALKLPTGKTEGSSTLLYEAKTAAGLRHPNIVAVYEVGESNGQVYIASEFIDGMTLRDSLSAGRPSLDRAVELLIPIAEALHFAHEHSVVHRDVKPANILLDKAGKPYVNDFGLAKRLSADETISSEGQVVGTARYMSPEQAYGKTEDTDARSDIYAVGVILFEMMTGESPFRGTARAILQQKVSQDAPSPRLLQPSIPRDLDTICLKCLERDPGKRFGSARELADELKRFADGEPIHSRPIGKIERGWRWCKRRPAISGLMFALFLSLTVGLLGVSYFGMQSAANARDAKQKLYRSWMNLNAAHLENGDPAAVRELLSRISADPQTAAMRSFEFDYFTNLVQQLTPVATLGEALIDVAVSQDGGVCAATSGDSRISVWNTNNGQLLRVLRGGQDGFSSIDLSPDGRSLVAGSIDGKIRFFEPMTNDHVVETKLHGRPIAFIACSPNGQHVISSARSGAARLWDARSHDLVAEIPTGKGETKAIRFSPDSSHVFVVRDDGLVRQWSVSALVENGLTQVPKPQREFNTGAHPVAICLSNSGDEMILAFFNGTIGIHPLTDQSPPSRTRTFETMWGLIQSLEPLADSSIVAATTTNGNTYFLDLESGREIRITSTHAATGYLSSAKDGTLLLVGSGDGTLSKLDAVNLLRPIVMWSKPLSPVRSVDFLSRHKVLAAYDNGTLAAWDLTDGAPSYFESAVWKPVMQVAVHAGRHLVATAGNRAGIEIRHADSLESFAEVPTPDAGVSVMRFSHSGKLLAVAIRQGPVQIFETDQWTAPRVSIPWAQQLVSSVDVSPDDHLVAVAHSGGAVDLHDPANGNQVGSIPLEHDVPWVVRFCQDDTTLAIGTVGGSLHLYDLPSQRIRSSSKAHTGRISALSVLPGTNRIASAGRDKALKLWDLQSGELVTRLVGHFRQVFSLAASDDGQTLVSGGLEGEVRAWHAPPHMGPAGPLNR